MEYGSYNYSSSKDFNSWKEYPAKLSPRARAKAALLAEALARAEAKEKLEKEKERERVPTIADDNEEYNRAYRGFWDHKSVGSVLLDSFRKWQEEQKEKVSESTISNDEKSPSPSDIEAEKLCEEYLDYWVRSETASQAEESAKQNKVPSEASADELRNTPEVMGFAQTYMQRTQEKLLKLHAPKEKDKDKEKDKEKPEELFQPPANEDQDLKVRIIQMPISVEELVKLCGMDCSCCHRQNCNCGHWQVSVGCEPCLCHFCKIKISPCDCDVCTYSRNHYHDPFSVLGKPGIKRPEKEEPKKEEPKIEKEESSDSSSSTNSPLWNKEDDDYSYYCG